MEEILLESLITMTLLFVESRYKEEESLDSSVSKISFFEKEWKHEMMMMVKNQNDE